VLTGVAYICVNFFFVDDVPASVAIGKHSIQATRRQFAEAGGIKVCVEAPFVLVGEGAVGVTGPATSEIRTMRTRVWKLLGWSICLAGALLALAAFWGIALYVWGVVDVWEEPDTSWIFWGLVFLLWGLIFLGVGVGAVIAGLGLLRR
jgi:hypothetical protein